MHRDARGRGVEDGVVAGVPLDRGTPRSGHALVARRRHVLEVDATGALEEVAGRGGLVPDLAGGAGEQGAGHDGIPAADEGVRGEVAVAHRRPDAEGAVGGLLHLAEGQPTDVDEAGRRGDTQLEVVDEVAATGDEGRPVVGRDGGDGRVDVDGPLVCEGPHREAASRMAATMLT